MPPNTQEPSDAKAPRPIREALPFRCPQCGASSTVSVQSIVDARDDAARRRLVDGTLNVARCSACGLASRLATPVLYHDGPHDIAYVLVPQALQLSHVDQEAAVGRLTNRVLNDLPPEERRMYLLQPTLYLGEAAFVEAVRAAPASASAPPARAAPASGARAGARPEDEAPIEVDFDDLVKALKEAQAAGALEDAVAELRMLLDYEFFVELTADIDGHLAEGRPVLGEELLALRSALVETIDRVDSTTRAALDAAVGVLKGVLTSEDPLMAVGDLPLEALNDAFFLVLSVNQQAAADAGDDATAERLRLLSETAVQAMEAKLPPLRRLVAKLARTNDEDTQLALLDADRALWDESLQAALYSTAAAARSGGAPEVADNLSAAGARLAMRMQGQREVA